MHCGSNFLLSGQNPKGDHLKEAIDLHFVVVLGLFYQRVWFQLFESMDETLKGDRFDFGMHKLLIPLML